VSGCVVSVLLHACDLLFLWGRFVMADDLGCSLLMGVCATLLDVI
jgi:hypothetical protein